MKKIVIICAVIVVCAVVLAGIVTAGAKPETPVEEVIVVEPPKISEYEYTYTDTYTHIPEPSEEPEPEPEPESEPEPEPVISDEAVYIAKTVWGEARGCSREEQEQVIWCILNRVDDPRFPNDVIGVVTQPYQFHGYSAEFPVEQALYDLAVDVLDRWKNGGERNLGPEYLYFSGDGVHNYFRVEY